jgi:hypothetical protein
MVLVTMSSEWPVASAQPIGGRPTRVHEAPPSTVLNTTLRLCVSQEYPISHPWSGSAKSTSVIAMPLARDGLMSLQVRPRLPVARRCSVHRYGSVRHFAKTATAKECDTICNGPTWEIVREAPTW